jgi:hypothetical protein
MAKKVCLKILEKVIGSNIISEMKRILKYAQYHQLVSDDTDCMDNRAPADEVDIMRTNAMDVQVDEGTPIVSKQSGIIVALGQDISTSKRRRGYGNYIDILSQDPRSGNMVVTRYAHLRYDPAVAGLAKGQKVRAGDPIAYTGNTGGSSGPHLHIESVPAEKVIEEWGSFEGRAHTGIYDWQKERLPTEEEKKEWIRMSAAEAIDPELYPDYVYQRGHKGGSGLGQEITINPALEQATDIEAPGDLNAYALDQMYGTDGASISA